MVTSPLSRKLPPTMMALLVLSGCASTITTPGPSTDTGAARAVIDTYLTYAQEAGAQSQVDLLTEARTANEVTFGIYRRSQDDFKACLELAGLGTQEYPPDNSHGYTFISIAWQPAPDMTQPQADALAEDCWEATTDWVSGAYESQPSSQEALFNAIQLVRPQIDQCLFDHGGVDSSEMDYGTLLGANEDVFFETVDPGPPVDCMGQFGF